MLAAKDFALASCQATLFTPDEEVSPAKLMRNLLPRWIERFDSNPTILPFPAGMPVPRDIARVILESASSEWRCEIASARINLFWRKNRKESQAPTPAEFYDVAAGLLNEYCNFLQARVGRLAAVMKRYAPQDSPGLLLAKHFCQERWLSVALSDVESFELHSHKRFSLRERFRVNLWIRSKSGTISYENESFSIVLIEQDLNTLSEEEASHAFTTDDISAFFGAASPELDQLLSLYYPQELLK